MSSHEQHAAKTAAQPTPEQAATFHATLDLYNPGFWLLPIGPEKRPYFQLLPRVGGQAVWKPLQTQRADANTICRWFQGAPDCNPGVVCGNSLIVIDVDGDKGRVTLSGLPELPRTVTAITGRETGGTHYYFRLKPGRWKRNDAGEELHNSSGIDLQADGHYVVAPPSLDPSGRRYRWAEGQSPNEAEIADAPEWVYGFLEEVTEEEETPVQTSGLRTPRYDISILEPSASESYPYEGNVNPDKTDPWGLYRDYEVAKRMAEACHLKLWTQPGPADRKGLRACSGTFHCILPGHDDRGSKSASLFIEPKTGCVKYRCWHGGLGDDSQTRLLPEVYFALVSGHVKSLKGQQLVMWLWKLLADARVWKLPELKSKPEGSNLADDERRVYRAFRQHMAIWELLAPGLPHAFSWQYGADLTGLSKDRVGRALQGLLDKGYIRACGKRQKGAKTLVLYKLVVPREPRESQPLSDEIQRLVDELEEHQTQLENEWQGLPTTHDSKTCPVCRPGGGL